MQKKNRSALKKIIILIVLFAAFVAFLIFSGRQQTSGPATSEQTTTAETDGIETKMTETYPPVETITADEGEKEEETTWNLLEQETRTISYGELETEAPEETMTTASVIAAGIIKDGGLEIDVSAVEDDLRQGELYSLADAITSYLSEQYGKKQKGEVQILFSKIRETEEEKIQTVVFQYGKQKYKAVKDDAESTSIYEIEKMSR